MLVGRQATVQETIKPKILLIVAKGGRDVLTGFGAACFR